MVLVAHMHAYAHHTHLFMLMHTHSLTHPHQTNRDWQSSSSPSEPTGRSRVSAGTRWKGLGDTQDHIKGQASLVSAVIYHSIPGNHPWALKYNLTTFLIAGELICILFQIRLGKCVILF